LVVGRPQLHDVVVGYQQATASQLANVLLTFALQRLRHFLGHDVATEHTRERVPHDFFQLAVQPLPDAHGSLLPAHVLLARSYPGAASWTVGCTNPGSGTCYAPSVARASGGMADAHGSGPCVRKDVGVQLPPRPLPLRIRVRGERGPGRSSLF